MLLCTFHSLPVAHRGGRGAALPPAALACAWLYSSTALTAPTAPTAHAVSPLQILQQDVLKPTVVTGKHLKVSSFHFKDSY